jgi:hypothetical protein
VKTRLGISSEEQRASRELLIKTLFDGVGAARIEGNFA